MKKIKKCPSCKSYSLATVCPDCGEETINPNPPKFSPEDRYGSYRRKLKIIQKRGN